MSRHAINPLLVITLVLLALTVGADAQTRRAAAEKKKAETGGQEYTKALAEFHADRDQRKAIVNDLIDTYTKCRLTLAQSILAKDGSPELKNAIGTQVAECYETLWAKINRTPLDVLTPFSSVGKGINLLDVKKAAFFRLYEAYEYGTEHPKPASIERKP